MKEKLRKSLDTAIMFQKLTNVYRTAIRQAIEEEPQLNDGLCLFMTTAHNGLGKISVQLYAQIELLNERIAILGDGEGMEKQIAIDFKSDGEDDFMDEGEEPQDKYIDADGDDEEYRDEWEVEDEE